jgi:epoxyqueuosine reductase
VSGRPHPAELTGRVKARALEEGFDAVGIAAASRLDRDGEALRAWLSDDRHASMAWMARDPEGRTDPQRLLPGCRSVIALAVNYWPGEAEATVLEGRAEVALYARGRDYHRVLGEALRRLALGLEVVSGCSTLACVDTRPVLERAWAQRAGLGWIGKNANLLTRDLGSWVMLGELLTQAELEPDPGPHADFCGTCTACLDACPTGAIVEPGVVDANACIAYWTIEHRGAIPPSRREEMGTWIFGCDICQSACPWNRRFARPAAGAPFGGREDLRGLDPAEVLSLDEAAFRARWSGTPLMRAKWEGMRRNACIVLGNRRDPAGAPALTRALADDDPVIRSHAAWALGRIGGPGSRLALDQARRRERDPEVRAEMERAAGAG